MMNDLPAFLQQLPPITLEEMSAVKLMNRTDTKYLLNQDVLYRLARHWQGHFYVQVVDNKLISDYKTLYFDTPNALMFTIHHNKKLHRQKVRQRYYVNSDITFCEIKTKHNTGKTKKKRILIPNDCWGDLYHNQEMADFIRNKVWVTEETLIPRIQNTFQRITLVDTAKTERVTIDFNIHFHNLVTLCDADVSNLVIVEVKQDGLAHSFFSQLLRNEHVLSKSISKYCLGMLLTQPNIKYNRFKSKIRYISKLINKNLTIKAIKND